MQRGSWVAQLAERLAHVMIPGSWSLLKILFVSPTSPLPHSQAFSLSLPQKKKRYYAESTQNNVNIAIAM